MYESDEDRIDAAELLAEQNPRAAAEAFSAIACGRAVGDEVRLSAAELLADVDSGAAGPACLAIARDRTVGDEVRLSAAERLADVNPRAAAPACLAIACDQAVGDEVRLSAAELLADVDPGAAAPACLAIARDQTVGDEVRRSAAERFAGLATLLRRKQAPHRFLTDWLDGTGLRRLSRTSGGTLTCRYGFRHTGRMHGIDLRNRCSPKDSRDARKSQVTSRMRVVSVAGRSSITRSA
jgi:hypothetical protein